jgi:hypothetical protein
MWCWGRIDWISWTDSANNEKNVTQSQEGKKCPTYNTKKEG